MTAKELKDYAIDKGHFGELNTLYGFENGNIYSDKANADIYASETGLKYHVLNKDEKPQIVEATEEKETKKSKK